VCCVRVCAFCALVFISSFFIRFALWCISKKNFETGTRGKSTKLRIKFHHIRPHISMPQIQYSEKYYDDVYEYRYAFILLHENVRSELGLRGRICPENAER
jgi:hypothetical protein